MPDTTMTPRGDALENGISQLGQGLVPPLALYSQQGCKGRIFLRHGYPSTSRMGSTRYVPQFPSPPIVSPPLQLFDDASRVFRLDLLVQYKIGGSIKYWLDENTTPEPYIEGFDYLGEILRNPPIDNSAALESGPSTIPVDGMAARNLVPSQSQHTGFQESFFTPNEQNVEYRNYGARNQIYFDIGLTATVPTAYTLGTADAASGLGNSVLRSSNPSDLNYTFPAALQRNHSNRPRQDSDPLLRTYGTNARMVASSGPDYPNWPTQNTNSQEWEYLTNARMRASSSPDQPNQPIQNTNSQEWEYLTTARMIASSSPDQPNQPIQNTNSHEGKYLNTARMIASSVPSNLHAGNDPAISNLVSAFPTEISGQSTVARNTGSFLLSAAATSLGGNSTPPPKFLAQSDEFPGQERSPSQSKKTEASGQSLLVTSTEPNAHTQIYPSQAFPTFTKNPGQSGYRSWTPIGSSLVEDSQQTLPYLEQSEFEAAQARARSAFLWAPNNAMGQPEVGAHATSSSATPVDTSAPSNIMRGQQGPGVARGRSARRARSTTARRGRGGVAQRGHLHYAKVERVVSKEGKPKRRKYDGDEESGA